MKSTERLEQQDIDAVHQAEREGGHPIGHRAVRQVLERTDTAQQGFDGVVNA